MFDPEEIMKEGRRAAKLQAIVAIMAALLPLYEEPLDRQEEIMECAIKLYERTEEKV